MIFKTIIYLDPSQFLEDYERHLKHNALPVQWENSPPLNSSILLKLLLFPDQTPLLLQGRVVICLGDHTWLSLQPLNKEQKAVLKQSAQFCIDIINKTQPSLPTLATVSKHLENASHIDLDLNAGSPFGPHSEPHKPLSPPSFVGLQTFEGKFGRFVQQLKDDAGEENLTSTEKELNSVSSSLEASLAASLEASLEESSKASPFSTWVDLGPNKLIKKE